MQIKAYPMMGKPFSVRMYPDIDQVSLARTADLAVDRFFREFQYREPLRYRDCWCAANFGISMRHIVVRATVNKT